MIKSYKCLNSGVNLLSKDEMLRIRGGAQPIKPKSRPREQLDWEAEAQIAGSTQSSEESSLIDYIKFWFKNR